MTDVQRPSRRTFVGLLGGAAAVTVLPACGRLPIGGTSSTGELMRTLAPLPKPYAVPLPVPDMARPSRRTHDTDYYEITAREATAQILPGLPTRILSYGGTFPGPTIASRSGRRTVVRHTNRLDFPMVVHLHGGHTPQESDGYPTDLILPQDGEGPATASMPHMGDTHAADQGRLTRGSFAYTYPMQQRAATLWYHDHRMDFTGATVYRGLAGFHLIHDGEEEGLPLPDGDKDIPLMITDRAFAADGSFRYPSVDPTLEHTPGVREPYMEGVLGDVILVNGAPWPEMEVTASRYRFRFLNASNARRYQLALDPAPREGKSFTQVGSDGGLLATPIGHDTIVIAQAERFDVVVDFSSYPVGSTVRLTNRLGEQASTRRVMRFRVTRTERDDSHVPARLSEIEVLDPRQATVHRHFDFARMDVNGRQMWAINGKAFDPARTDAAPRLGQVERWRFTTDVHHPIHVHLDPFQVAGGGPYTNGWKDTVDVHPAHSVDVLVRFNDYTGTFLMHCHNLEHEDMSMMANIRTHT
jgi:spore coat protein A, manganese oxidase